MKSKVKLLALVQLPPPIHGASVMNEVADRVFRNEYSDSYRVIDMNFSDNLSELRKIGIKKFLRLFNIGLKILKAIFFERPNLIYFTLTPTGNGFYRDVLIVAIIKLFRIKIVYHLHGKGISARESFWDEKLYSFVFNNSKVILLADCLYEDIKAYINKNNVFVLPNALDVQRLNGNAKKEYDFGYLSNLVQGKGIVDFITSLHDLYKGGKRSKSLVVGGYRSDGTEEAVKSYLAKCPRDFIDSIEFSGPLYGDDKAIQISKCKIFIFPTYIDTFPLVLIEALGLSLPCITYNEGATSEIVDDELNGKVVGKGDKAALSQAMLNYFQNEEIINKHANNAREKYENNYSITQFEGSLINIIEQCISGND